MKLILAIVSNDDSAAVSNALNGQKYQVTKLATTGGFLSKGNTTLIIGCENDLVDKAIEIIGEESKTRAETTFINSEYAPMPVQVTVGGATIFVLDVEQFYKL